MALDGSGGPGTIGSPSGSAPPYRSSPYGTSSPPPPMSRNTSPLWSAMDQYDRNTPRPNPNQALLDRNIRIFGNYNRPALQGLNNQFALQQNQMALDAANQATQAGFLRDDYGLAVQGLGLDQRALGIDRRGVQRNLGFSRQEEAIARQMLTNTQAQTNQGALEATQAARNEAIAGGAMAAPGITTDLTNIYGNLVMDREANQLGFNRDLLGIRQQRGNLRDQARTLNVEADRLGLTRQQLTQSLDQGLANLRISGFATTNDLMMALNDTNMQRRQMAQDIYQQALQAAQQSPRWR